MRTLTRLAIAIICISSAAFAGNAPKEKNMKPVDVLQKEHGIIKKIALKTGEIAAGIEDPGDVNPQTLAKLHDFFVNFADKCHHAKEEDKLFPQLREKDVDPTIIDLLVKQHEEGRILLAGVKRELEAFKSDDEKADLDALSRYLQEYKDLMVRHIETENKYLWPKARKALSAEEESNLSEAFHRIETVRLGKGFHEKYHGMAMDILGKSKQ